jgi:glucose-6-phosphate 1-epimerase
MMVWTLLPKRRLRGLRNSKVDLSNCLDADLFGGHILQARLNGDDVFYVAPKALHQAGQPRRGGVPVLFPQFNNDGTFPKHGFARVMNWQIVQADGAAQVTDQHWRASLIANSKTVTPFIAHTPARWPHQAELVIDAVVKDNSLWVSLTVKNIGTTEFSFAGGLHPYFCWPKGDIEIEQLGVRLSRDLMMQSGAGIEEKFLHRSDKLTVLSTQQKMTIKKFGFEEWMLWNPGPKHSLRDIEFCDWQSFYCLEPISSVKPHVLKPQEVFTGGFSIQIEPR